MGTLGEYLRYIVDVFYIFCLFSTSLILERNPNWLKIIKIFKLLLIEKKGEWLNRSKEGFNKRKMSWSQEWGMKVTDTIKKKKTSFCFFTGHIIGFYFHTFLSVCMGRWIWNELMKWNVRTTAIYFWERALRSAECSSTLPSVTVTSSIVKLNAMSLDFQNNVLL